MIQMIQDDYMQFKYNIYIQILLMLTGDVFPKDTHMRKRYNIITQQKNKIF